MQVTKVELDLISKEMLCKMIVRFKQLATGELLTKVVKPATQMSNAVVELYIRVTENNVLASINKTLEFEPQLK